MGVGVNTLFALAINGGSKVSEVRRTGRGASAPFAALGTLSLIGFLAVVAFAITVILKKS
jgi:hypothetical protein